MGSPNENVTSRGRVADPVRLGFAGCGTITRRKHLRVISAMPEIEVVAVADPNQKAREDTAREYGIAGVYADISAMLDHPGLEAVGVMVPSRFHADIAVAVLRAGKHVLVEKPLAETLEDGARIAQAASESAARAVMGFHICSHRLVEEGLRLVEAGAVGTVESVRTLWCSPWRNPQQYGSISAEQMRHRHHEGALVDLATPCFELWRRFTGQEVEVVWAQCLDGSRPEEVATVSARLSNGVLATGTFSTRTSHEIEIEVCGSEGRLRIGGERFDGLELRAPGRDSGIPQTTCRGSSPAHCRIARVLANQAPGRHLSRFLRAPVAALRGGGSRYGSHRMHGGGRLPGAPGHDGRTGVRPHGITRPAGRARRTCTVR